MELREMVEAIDDENVRERIRRVVKEVVGRLPDTDDGNLRDIGVDSFTVVELTMALESEFSITIPDEQLEWCKMENIGLLSQIVVKGLSAESGTR